MFQFFINDEEVICDSNFEISEEFMNPSSIELTNVYPKSWKGTNKLLEDYYYPEDYSKCKVLKNGELFFIGIVKNTADMQLNPFKPHFCSVQILDPSTLLSEGITLDYVIVDKTVSEAIMQVINSISDYGFVAGNIMIPEEENTIIGAYSTLDKAPFDVFQFLSLVSGTRWGTHMVDENTTAIDFYSPELLENLGIIDVSKSYCTSKKIEDITYDYSTTDYRNKQIVTSEQVFADISSKNTLIANGYDNTFYLEQIIGKINSINVNGESKTFATKEEKELGITADFYYETSKTEITSNETFSAGTEIIVDYIALVQGREIAYNTSELYRIRKNLNRNGTISRYESRSDVTGSKELQAVAKSYIKYKGYAEITINIKSRTDFLKLGGKYQFNSKLSKINGFYLVKNKKTNVLQAGEFIEAYYEYELNNNFDTENELNYFDNQRSKNNGNISEGQYISRNIDVVTSTDLVFSDLEIKEVQVENDNVLNAIINSPFVK